MFNETSQKQTKGVPGEQFYFRATFCWENRKYQITSLISRITKQTEDTWVVFIFLDLQFDQLLALLEDLHGLLHGTVLHPDVINGQQLVSQLQRSRPGNQNSRHGKNIIHPVRLSNIKTMINSYFLLHTSKHMTYQKHTRILVLLSLWGLYP